MSAVAIPEPVAPAVIPAQHKQANQSDVLTAGARTGVFFQPKLTVGSPDDPMEREADSMAEQVMRMPETPFLQQKYTQSEEHVQRDDKAETPTLQLPTVQQGLPIITPQQFNLQITQPDFLSLRQPFFQRNVLHLWDGDSALGVWNYNRNFFTGLGLGADLSAKAANFTAPFFIDSQLKAANPTWWEITDRDLNTSSFVASIPIFDFDANFRNWRPLPFLQPKLINTSVDFSASIIQRKCAHCEEEEKAQRKPLAQSVTPFIQTKSEASPSQTGDAVSQSIQSSRGTGSSMDNHTKSFMSERFGSNFNDVNIHTNTNAVQLSRDLNARAFTVGNDIYFNQGQYQPETSDGKFLLAHELTHTLQQTSSLQRSMATIAQPIRNKISLWDVVINASTLSPAALNDYFRTTAPSSSTSFNGTIVIDSTVNTAGSTAPYDLSTGLNNIPGLLMAERMPVNSTITLNMDLSTFGGQTGIFRCTYINTNTSTAASATPVYQFHIEFVAGTHTAAAQSARPTTIAIGSNSFIASGTWPDARYDELVEVLGRLPSSVQTKMNGLRIRYQPQLVQTPAQLGEDGEATIGTGIASSARQIIIWNSVARPTITNYNGFSRTSYVVAHEIGHWLDFMPIADAFEAANTAGSTPAATDSLSGYYHMDTRGDFAESANRPTPFQRLNVANAASTGYGATDLKESFAEYFALYVTEPTLLQELRPTIYRFFSRRFP